MYMIIESVENLEIYLYHNYGDEDVPTLYAKVQHSRKRAMSYGSQCFSEVCNHQDVRHR